MITRAECFALQPEDRDYNKKGKPRKARMEVLGDGIAYCLRTEFIYGLLIWEDDTEN